MWMICKFSLAGVCPVVTLNGHVASEKFILCLPCIRVIFTAGDTLDNGSEYAPYQQLSRSCPWCSAYLGSVHTWYFNGAY